MFSQKNRGRLVFTTVKSDHMTSFLIRKSGGFIWYTYYVGKFKIFQFYDFFVTFYDDVIGTGNGQNRNQ